MSRELARIAQGLAYAVPKSRAPTAVRDQGNESKNPVPQLRDMFGTFQTRACGFALIPVPTQAAPAAGLAAWYGLGTLSAEQFGQEFQLAGWSIEHSSTDPSAGAGFLQWGSSQGTLAAIIIGRNLPIQLGAWTTGPCSAPSVVATGTGLISKLTDAQYIARIGFPPGSQTDSIPFKRTTGQVWLPVAENFLWGEQVQVALAIRSAANAGATIQLRGYADVALTLAETAKSRILKR